MTEAPGPPAAPVVESADPPPSTATITPTPTPTPTPIQTPTPASGASTSTATSDELSPRTRQLIAGLLIGGGYDAISPATMGATASHATMVPVTDSLPIGSGDRVAAATLGFGDARAYDLQLDIGPTFAVGPIRLSTLVGLGYDQVDGTGMQFARAGTDYVQFLVRASVPLGIVSIAGSTAILDHESRDTVDLVWHVPSRVVHSLAVGLRYTDYEIATRTGGMVTLGF
ncbi:MAG: hypothetical protein ABI467_20290 [Kofleriaceae bacterium]